MPAKQRVCVHLTSGQIAVLKLLSEYTSITQAEIMRKATDRWMQPAELNEILPNMSGQFAALLMGGK